MAWRERERITRKKCVVHQESVGTYRLSMCSYDGREKRCDKEGGCLLERSGCTAGGGRESERKAEVGGGGTGELMLR